MKRLIEVIQRAQALTQAARFDPRIRSAATKLPVAGKKVLLAYTFPGLGDAVLLAPVVQALLDLEPATPVGLLLRENAARIWKAIDLPVRIHVLPEALVEPMTPLRAAASSLREESGPTTRKKSKKKTSEGAPSASETKALHAKLVTQLARKKYDVAVDLSCREEADARRWLHASNAKACLGWLRPYEDLSHAGLDGGAPDTRAESSKHWSRSLAEPLAPLGVSSPRFDVPFVWSDADEEKARELWPARSARVLVIPGSRAVEKRWSESCFIAAAHGIAARTKSAFVVCGAPSEAELLRRVAKGIDKGTKVFAGKSLTALLALIDSADVVVTNDTGPMHFAFLAGTPTVALFATMSPLIWGPPTSDPRFVALRVPEAATDAAAEVWTRWIVERSLEALARGKKPKS